MAQFKEGDDLAIAIKNVLAGKDVRSAVAFWGKGSNALFQNAAGKKPRIVCDVTLGGTSGEALRVLGAPNNSNLRQVPGLHSKVYISDRGAIVASANASRNGIGFDGSPGLIEAGVQIGSDEKAFAEAASWFEQLWSSAKPVDEVALAQADKRFRPVQGLGNRSVRPGSLLDLICDDPSLFADVSIVLTQTESTPEQRDEVRAAAAEVLDQAVAVKALPDSGIFTGWSRREIRRWRHTFIELWMPKNRLYPYGREVVFSDPKLGAVISRGSWPAVRQAVVGELPNVREIAQNDGPVVRRLLDEREDRLYNAQELAAAIGALREIE